VLVNQLWVSSDPPVRTIKTPKPIGARHQWHPRSRLCSQASPLSQKAWPILCSLLPASAIQLSKAWFSQERICPRHQCSLLSNLQLRPAPTQYLSIIFAISHSVDRAQSHPSNPPRQQHRCATPLPACRNVGVRGCCRNNWLARNPAKPNFTSRQFHNHPLPPARRTLKYPHSERLTDLVAKSDFFNISVAQQSHLSHSAPTSHKIGAGRSDDSRTTRLGKVLSSGVVSRRTIHHGLVQGEQASSLQPTTHVDIPYPYRRYLLPAQCQVAYRDTRSLRDNTRTLSPSVLPTLLTASTVGRV
jgi:hypothetical protein